MLALLLLKQQPWIYTSNIQLLPILILSFHAESTTTDKIEKSNNETTFFYFEKYMGANISSAKFSWLKDINLQKQLRSVQTFTKSTPFAFLYLYSLNFPGLFTHTGPPPCVFGIKILVWGQNWAKASSSSRWWWWWRWWRWVLSRFGCNAWWHATFTKRVQRSSRTLLWNVCTYIRIYSAHVCVIKWLDVISPTQTR